MTPQLHTQTAPRVPGCLDGPAAPQFGEPGDLCACGARLSSYNEYDACYHCQGHRRAHRRPIRKRGAAVSVGSEAATDTAQPPRRVSVEVLEMAAEERRKTSEAKGRVLAALTDEYDAAPRIAMRAEVKEALCYYHLKRLVDDGRAENKLGKGGGYRLRQNVAAQTSTWDEAPPPPEPPEEVPALAPVPEPGGDVAADPAAPVTPPQEPPAAAGQAAATETALADLGMAVSTLARAEAALQAPVPFAGTVELASAEMDSEVTALGDCVQALAGLEDGGCRRVLEYLAARFIVDERRAS